MYAILGTQTLVEEGSRLKGPFDRVGGMGGAKGRDEPGQDQRGSNERGGVKAAVLVTRTTSKQAHGRGQTKVRASRWAVVV